MRDNTALIERVREGDKQAENRMVEENMGLVYSIARRFLNRGYDAEDLTQIGAIGLIKAVKKFNPEFNVQFSTYAVPMITGEIKRFLCDDGAVKISRTLKENAMKGDKEIRLLDTITGEEIEDGVINKVMIDDILSRLTEREKEIILLRYFRGKTQSEIAKIIGVSQVQISRIEKKAIERIRGEMP